MEKERNFGELAANHGIEVVVERPVWTGDGREEIKITLSSYLQDGRLYEVVEQLGLVVGQGCPLPLKVADANMQPPARA